VPPALVEPPGEIGQRRPAMRGDQLHVRISVEEALYSNCRLKHRQALSCMT
jgi:hypothetical protein